MNTLSFCSTKTAPAVTMSDLSSVVLVSAYSEVSFFSIEALVPWSSATAVEHTQTNKPNSVLYLQIFVMTVLSSSRIYKGPPATIRFGSEIIHPIGCAGNAKHGCWPSL